MTHPLHVPPTLEGRVMVELGATLARARRDHQREVDFLTERIDVLERQGLAWQLRAEDAFLENTRLRALLELVTGTTAETLWPKA